MITFQEILRRLTNYWEQQGCIIHQGYDGEVGAGTFNPATFLRCLGPEPYRAAYIEPCRRPGDGRYGENPNRLQHYFQYQVIIKPSPFDIQEKYLESLEAIGFNLKEHDIRFIHDDWENPTIGAWGLGWEIWMDGMEVTQFTYFQSVGGLPLKPITVELTYGIERLAMYLQNVDSIFDLQWDEHLTYGDIYHRNEVEWSHYNFEKSNAEMWLRHFNDYETEAKKLINDKLPLPAYDFVMKASHAFNMLDARGAISVTERTGYIRRIRDLAKQIAESYVQSREALGYPLLGRFGAQETSIPTSEGSLDDFAGAHPDDKADFLLEIGSEELPATFVPIGMRNLEKDVGQLLDQEGIHYQSMKVWGTPRRLSLYIKDLSKAKASATEEKRGPAIANGFDADGKPTRAVTGFLASLDISPMTLPQIRAGKNSGLYIQDVKGTEYLFAKRKVPGFSTAELLAQKLPGIIEKLDFPKSMHWADLDITFARPLRWIVALHGDAVVPFVVGNIASGRTSHGHRQLSPTSFAIVKASDYLALLRQYKVMVDHNERTREIERQLDEIEAGIHGKIIHRDQVLKQVVFMSEWPKCFSAEFNREFLKAPKEVLTSEMIEHQKYFPVVENDGSLKDLFIITADNKPSDLIARGNQKVLSARLSDGVFLYAQGQKTPLANYNEKLKVVTFQEKLGSVYDKVERIIAHAETIQKLLKIGDPTKVKRAALLSKADLASEMVFEFPELQGVIGKYYAQENGEDPEVALAIEEQWMPRGEKDSLPKTPTGIVLSLADKFDNLIGCYCADLKPTSSSDPYALRRQTLGIIRTVIEHKLALPLHETLQKCFDQFPDKIKKGKESVIPEIEQFLINRVKTVFLDYGFDKDEIEASLSHGFNDIYDAFCRVKSLHAFRKEGKTFSALFEAYKRAKGQLNGHVVAPFSKNLLVEPAEINLDAILNTTETQFAVAIEHNNYEQAYRLLAQIQQPIATLFSEVKILADDAKVKENRIALLQRVFGLFDQVLDFSKIQG